MHCISLNLVGVNWNQSCSRYHRHVSKYYPINFCLFQILCDSWQERACEMVFLCTRSHSLHTKGCLAHGSGLCLPTQLCVHKHERDVRAVPIFRRWGDMWEDTHVHSVLWQLLSTIAYTSKESKQPSLHVTKAFWFIVREVPVQLRCLFEWVVSVPVSLACLTHAR
jgi:hypothetical protein